MGQGGPARIAVPRVQTGDVLKYPIIKELVQFIKTHLSDVEWDMTKDGVKFAVGAAIGWILKILRDRWRTRRAHSFWRPFLTGDVRLVIGRFEDRDFERSGLLGLAARGATRFSSWPCAMK